MASCRKLLLLCSLVASTVAVPVSQRGQCARYCTDGSDFKLEPGKTYTYNYETTAATVVQTSTQDKSQLQMTAQADIEVISKCELSLRLRSVVLKLSDPESPENLVFQRGSRDFSRSIEKAILRFSYQNGQVEHVCPSEDVPDWVTNIHKGVLSAFQTYMVKPDWTTRTLETDILGKCTAEYHSLGKTWQDMHTIRKIKDLGSCTDREDVQTFLQGTPYSQGFASESLPVLKGTQECEQVIGKGYLQSSTCSEKLVFRPFSGRGNGVVTTVIQKLTYTTTSERVFTGNDYRPTKQLLLYTHAKPEVNSAMAAEEAELALKELCDAAKEDITIFVPRKFSSLVYKLKSLPLNDLKTIFHKTEKICPGNTKARKFFLDAIPLVSTSDSARFMYDMITRKVVSDAETNFWLTSLSFVNDPTPEMILTFSQFLDGRYDQAILGISSLIKNYCSRKDCSNVPEVETAVKKLFENLGENCFSPEDKKIILSLKAIGNIGHLFGQKRILEACYKNPQIRTEARLAAIEAFRRSSCDISRDDLLNTYRNYDDDTEIRIAAYLAVMKCPTASNVEAVKSIMMGEKINHVGSFVWTHLNALSRTRHPERQIIKDIVSNLYLMNKFGSDARKFSSAHEATYFLQALDSGIHVDSHLIFSTQSYLPKTAMLNLTVDVFGKTCNLFQIDGRMEGMEEVVERFFGPSGYFPQKNVAKLLRERRAISNSKLDDVTNKFNEHRVHQQPYGSVDIKVFGTSMWYSQYSHDDGTPDINLLDMVKKLAEERDTEYSRSFMFLDTTFTVPMTSGLPLKIALNGTASVGLKIGGKFDVKSFERMDILGRIEPSGAVEIASLLTVDAGTVARSGMRVVSTLHSSTLLDGKLEVKNGEVVKAQLNMPRERIDIFNVESKVYLVHGPEEREKKTSGRKASTHLQSCTGETSSKIFGVRLCSELQLPPYRPNAALHPLSGSGRFNLYIQKTDPTLKSYNFDAQWKSEEKKGGFMRYGMIAMNTPESTVDRDVKMEVYVNQADRTATFKLKTPVKKLAATAKFMNEDYQKKLDFGVTVDDKEYFNLLSELKTSTEDNAVTYTPSLEIKLPSRRLAALSGSATLRHGHRYTGQLKLEELTERPIITKVNIEMGKKDRYDVELSLNSFAIDSSLKGYAQMGTSMSSRITTDYRIMEGKMNKFSIVSKVRNLSANSLAKYSGLLNIQASALPEWNTEISFETMKTTGHIENSVSVSLGDGARSRVHTIKIQEILRYEGNLRNNKIDASLSFVYPEKSLDYALTVGHENTENTLRSKLELQYDSNKKVNTEVELKVNTDKLMLVSGDVKLKYPGRTAAFQTELLQTSEKEFRGAVSCQWQHGRKVSFIANYKDKCEGSRLKYEINGNMQVPSYDSITFATTVGYHMGQFATFSEVNVGSSKYRAKADVVAGNGFNHRMSAQLDLKENLYALDAAVANVKGKLSCNAELKMPNSHRATVKFESRIENFLKVASFETYWDADRDSSKRFVINGELRNQNEAYDGKFNMQILRWNIKGLVSTSLQGNWLSPMWKTNNKVELQWSPTETVSLLLSSNGILDRSRRQINGHLEFTSPFDSYENMTLNIVHLSTNQQWNSEISTLLPYSKNVVLSSNGEYSFNRGALMDVTVKMQSSFKSFEEFIATFYHNHNSRELTNKARFQWAMNKSVQYLLNLRHQSSIASGTIQINSPFQNYQDLSASINHDYTGDKYKTRGEMKWAPSKMVTFNIESNHELSTRRRICSVSYEGTSPFRGYESTSMKVIYSSDGSTINSDSEVAWNRNKLTSSFSVSVRNHAYNKNVEGKLHLTSPFKNFENIQVTSSLEMTENSFKINVDNQLPYRSTATFYSQGKLAHLNDLEFNVVVMCNFPKIAQPQRVVIDVVHKLQNSKLRSTFDAAYGNDRLTVLAIGLDETAFNTRNTEFALTVNTPFVDYEEMKMEFVHNQKGSVYYSKIHANKNKLIGSLTHKIEARDILNFVTSLEMSTTSPTSSLSYALLSIAHAGNRRHFEHTTNLVWSGDKKINLNAQFSDKSFMKEGFIKLSTPFQKLKDLEAKASTEIQDWEHKGSVSVTWNKKNKMTLNGEIKNFKWESLAAQLEFTSPFKNHERYFHSIKYDLSSPQKSAEMSFIWNHGKNIVMKGSFLNSYHQTNLELSMESSFNEFEKVSFSTKFDNQPPQKNLNVLYVRGWRIISLNAKSVSKNNAGEVSLTINSPYEILKQFSGSAKYNKVRNGMTGEFEAVYNNNMKYTATSSYDITATTLKGKFDATTTHSGMKNLKLELNGQSNGPDVGFKLTSDCDGSLNSIDFQSKLTQKNGDVSVEVKTPFMDLDTVKFNSKYTLNSGTYEGEVKLSHNKNKNYLLSFNAKHGGRHLAELQLNLDSPYRPLKQVQLILSVDSTSEKNQLLSTLKWEDKRMDVHLLLNKKTGEFYEAKVKLDTPFEVFKTMSFESSLKNVNNQFIDGRVIIATPFNALKHLDISGEYKNDGAGYAAIFKINNPVDLKFEGKMSNSRLNPLLASLDIEAPFMSFRKISTKVNVNIVKENNFNVEFSMKSHKFENSLKMDFNLNNKNFAFKLNPSSTLLPFKTATVMLNADYGDLSNIKVDASIETMGKVHSINGQYIANSEVIEAQMQVESSLLPENKVTTNVKVTRRRSEESLEILFTIPSSTHRFSAKFENKGNEITCKAVIDSDLLKFSRATIIAKYINSNNRDIMASLSLNTPGSNHEVTGSIKNYEGEKIAQLKIECPMSKLTNPFSITGTFKHEGYASVDSSLLITSAGKELRIAGNMKNVDFQDYEAFLAINTPFDTLKMMRLDGHFKTDRAQNIDCNFKLETSNPNLSKLDLSSKLTRSSGSDEISIMFRLPIRNLPSVQILGNVHYDSTYSNADSRITLTLPRNKFVVYGQYGITKSRVSGRGEIEVDSSKWELFGRLDRSPGKNDVIMSYESSNGQRYKAGAAYGQTGNRREVAVSYFGPNDKRYNLNTTLIYESPANFEVKAQAETPYYDFRNLQGTLQQRYSTRHFSTNIEYSKNDGKKGFLKVHHSKQRDSVKGTFQVACPYHNLKEVKLTYNAANKYANVENSLSLDYNRVNQLKTDVILFGEKSSHIVFDVPSLSWTMTADSKKLDNGRELNLKSTCSSRVVSFSTSYQNVASQFLHSAAFSWDEKHEKRISYDVKLADTESGKELLSRLDTPIRSLMLKGNFTKSNLSTSGGVSFYWDASRSLEKNIDVGFVHTDYSSSKKTEHRVQLILEHYRLSKRIIQTTSFAVSDSELIAKGELLYSPDQDDSVLLEVRATDMSRQGRENHYKAEMSVRHMASKVDVRGTAEVIDSRLETHAQLKLNTLDRNLLQNVREIKAKIMKLRQEIEVMTRMNDNHKTYSGLMTNRGSDLEITAERRDNEKKDLSLHVKINQRQRTFEATLVNADNVGYMVSATAPKTSIGVKVSHTHQGNAIMNAEIYLGLEQSRILRSKVNWRPIRWRDVKINTISLRNYMRKIQTGFEAWRADMSQEFSSRVPMISKSVTNALSPLVKDMHEAINQLSNDVRSVRYAFSRMQSRNEFYMKDIAEEIDRVKSVIGDIFGGLSLGFEVLYNIAVEQIEEMYEAVYYGFLDLSEYLEKMQAQLSVKAAKMLVEARKAIAMKLKDVSYRMSKKFKAWKEEMIVKCEKWLKSYAPYMIDGYYYAKNTADRIRNFIEGFTTSASKTVTNNSFFVALNGYAENIWSTFLVVRDFEYAESAQSFFNRVYNAQLIDSITNHPQMVYISDVAKTAIMRTIEVYHNMGLDVVVAASVDSATDYLKSVALQSTQELVSDFYKARAGAKYEFAPERGQMSMEFNLPVPRDSLLEVVDFKSYPEFEKMKTIHTVASEYYENFCIWDVYYKVMKYFTPSYWLPAFNAHAIISGNQHYITFDKLAYDFAGRCSYLLAKDFVDGNFTAVVNYGADDHARKSVTILVDGRKVDIGSDYRITLDNVRSESPLQVGETVVIREGSNVRVENEKKGFSLICNFVYNYCSVSVSGFYFGKTAGLFGTFNYEPKLDMMTPDRYLKDDVESFAHSWEVGQQVCRFSENYATLPSNDNRVQDKCRNLFERPTSEFRACFKQVKPDAYMRMCVSDLSAVHERDFSKAMCESAAAYFAECKLEGVTLRMPSHCVRCEKQDGTYLTEGQALRLPANSNPNAADIVFLVEEKECNKERVRYLPKLAHGIEENFKEMGYNEIRYSVVGFGGNQIHAAPHIHTIDGLESGSLRSLESTFETLQFGDGPVNILEALRFAAGLSYRPGTTKAFILVKCSTCQSEEDNAEYSEMVRTLMDSDITLHLLMEQKYEMKVSNKNAKARRVIGIDKKLAYSLKDSRSPGETDLLPQLRIPKDVCIPLALELGGSSFDAQYLLETRRSISKKFVDILSRIVARSSAEANAASPVCCECIADENGVGRSVCQKCVPTSIMASVQTPGFSRS